MLDLLIHNATLPDGLDRAGLEGGLRELGHAQPGRLDHFGVGLGRTEGGAAGVDGEADLAGLGLLRVEGDLGVELAELALDGHAHLLADEAHLALGGIELLLGEGGLADQHEEGGGGERRGAERVHGNAPKQVRGLRPGRCPCGRAGGRGR